MRAVTPRELAPVRSLPSIDAGTRRAFGKTFGKRFR
jgi:hypothetical protein